MSDYDDLPIPDRKLFGVSFRWIMFYATILVVLGIVLYLVVWVFKPMEMTSPDNLARLSQEANDSWQALQAKRQSISGLESKASLMITLYGEDMAAWPQGKKDEYLQINQQIINLKISYNSDCGEYKAMWNDEWRAIPAPDDLPTTCEFLE